MVRLPFGQIEEQPLRLQDEQGTVLSHLSLRRRHSAQDMAPLARLYSCSCALAARSLSSRRRTVLGIVVDARGGPRRGGVMQAAHEGRRGRDGRQCEAISEERRRVVEQMNDSLPRDGGGRSYRGVPRHARFSRKSRFGSAAGHVLTFTSAAITFSSQLSLSYPLASCAISARSLRHSRRKFSARPVAGRHCKVRC